MCGTLRDTGFELGLPMLDPMSFLLTALPRIYVPGSPSPALGPIPTRLSQALADQEGGMSTFFDPFPPPRRPNRSVSRPWPGPRPGARLTQRLELMNLAASPLALLCQRLHLDQVDGIRSQVVQGHREALGAAHVVTVGVALWMRAGRGRQLGPPETIPAQFSKAARLH